MRQKVIIIFAVCAVAAVLIGLNALSYSQKERPPDSEVEPNRSTFNSGTTGTQVFYTLLAETGRNVVRWQEPAGNLLPFTEGKPKTFVAIGPFRRGFTVAEESEVLAWVGSGGHLVLIDRTPPEGLVATTANWKLQIYRPAAVPEGDETIAKPVQPTLLSAGVNSVRLSSYTGSITMSRNAALPTYNAAAAPDPYVDGYEAYEPEPTPYDFNGSFEEIPDDAEVDPNVVAPPPPAAVDQASGEEEAYDGDYGDEEPRIFNAPIVHLRAGGMDVLAEVPYGAGKITYLTDPFIVSNTGVSELDNAQLAINITGADSGMVAFDEYHQGFGSQNNRLLEFFEGTPVVAIFLQLILVIGVVMYSRSRRFARPVPEPEPDRLSKLEYVAAMAELQLRTKAFDLAVENVYTDLRRRVARLHGSDATSVGYTELAEFVAGRIGEDPRTIAELFFACEDVIRGEPVGKRETVRLIAELRRIEQKLGLRRTSAGVAGGR